MGKLMDQLHHPLMYRGDFTHDPGTVHFMYSHVQRRLHTWSRYSTLYVLSCTVKTSRMIQVQYTLCTLMGRGDFTQDPGTVHFMYSHVQRRHDPGTVHFMYSHVQRRLHAWSRYSRLYVLSFTEETSRMIQVQYTFRTLMYRGDFTHDPGSVHFMYSDVQRRLHSWSRYSTIYLLSCRNFFFLSKVPFPGKGNE